MAKPGGMIGLLAGVPKASAKPSSSPPADDAELMAAESLIEAVNGGDAAAVKSAFQRMYDACAASEKSGETDEYEAELA